MSSRAAGLPPSPTAIKAISAVVGVLALGVLVNAIIAGTFVTKFLQKNHATGGINAHMGVGDLIVLLAVAAVAIAFTLWRGKAGFQVVAGETVALLIFVIIEFGIGQSLEKHSGLLAIHIPVALVIFGITTHLSSYVANLRRVAR
jgi:hypothetical protein